MGLVRTESCASPDPEVVERVRAGDVGRVEGRFGRYNQKLYRSARSVFPNDPS